MAPSAFRAILRNFAADAALTLLSCLLLVWVLARVFAEPTPTSAAVRGAPIGRLTSAVREVRRRYDGALVWQVIGAGAPLYDGDAVYVPGGSGAVVDLVHGGDIDIDERSLVILRPPSASAAVDVLRGGAVGRAASGRGLRIEAGGTTMTLARGAQARVRLASGRGAEVEVHRGRVKVGTAALRAGDRARLDAKGSAGPVQHASIRLEAPADAARLYRHPGAKPVLFRWHDDAAGGAGYVLELSRDADFRHGVIRVPAHGSSVQVPLPPAGIYTWRVRRSGAVQARSTIFRLWVVSDPPPTLLYPRSGAVVDLSLHHNIGFQWIAVAGVEQYRIELRRTGEPGAPLVSTTSSRPSFLLEPPHGHPLAEGRYCYRVKSADPARGASPWSKRRCFRVITRPVLPAPRLFEPKDTPPAAPSKEQGFNLWWIVGSVAHAAEAAPVAADAGIVLRWQRIPGAAAYLVEIAATRQFSQPLLKKRVTQNALRWHPPARRNYYWRVRAIDAYNRAGKVSAARVLALAVPVPQLDSPADGARLDYGSRPPVQALRCGGAPPLVRIDVQVARDRSFAQLVVDQRVGLGEAVSFSPPAAGTYFWRAIGETADGARSTPSAVRSLHVVVAAPDPLDPRQAASLTDAAVSLHWSARPVATYEVEVAPSRHFAAHVTRLHSHGRTATFRAGDYGRYYWRVRGLTPSTTWSVVHAFRVLPATPMLHSPAAGAAVAPGEAVTFRWEPVHGAARYRLRVEAVTSGDGPAIQPHTVDSDTPEARVQLPPGSYRWSVRALGHGGAESGPAQPRALRVGAPEARRSVPAGPAPAIGPLAHIAFAPRLGLFYNTQAIASLMVGLAVSYGWQLGPGSLLAGLSIAYYAGSTELPQTSAGVRRLAHVSTVPIAAEATYVLPVGIIDLLGAVGLGPIVVASSVDQAPQRPLASTGVLFGSILRIGAERRLGPGALVAAIAVTLSAGSASPAPATLGASGMSLTLGYRLSLGLAH